MAALSETNATAKEFFSSRKVIPFGNLTDRWNIERTEQGLLFEERVGPAERYIGLQPFGVIFNFERDGTVSAKVRPAKSEESALEEFFPNVTDLAFDKDSLLFVSGDKNIVDLMELSYLSRKIRRATQVLRLPTR